MVTNTKQLLNYELYLVLVVYIAYGIGTLTIQHYLPSQVDFIPNITVIGLLCLGTVWLLRIIKIESIGLDTIFWLLLFVLVLIQPFFITINYLDGLIFPLATLLACIILSAIVANVANKNQAIRYSTYGLIIAGLVSILTQLFQYLGIAVGSPFIMQVKSDDIRFYGNVAQPNQLAFIYALATTACHFVFFEKTINKTNFKWQASLLVLLALFAAGIALSSSRGGLVLMVASLSFYFISAKNLFGFVKTFLPASLAMLVGYFLGLYLLSIYAMPIIGNAVGRMTEGSLYLRLELLQQAWVQFLNHPILGVGLGNLLADSINHVEELDWFVFSIHSHNIVAQVAAEMGIVGLALLLLPLYIIVKGYWQSRSIENSFVLIALLIVGLYSLSEYPLWFTRFLVLAVFLLAIINTKTIKLNLNMTGLFAIISIIIVIGSGYYYYQYKAYSRVNSYLINYDYSILEDMSFSERQEFADIQVTMVTDLAPIFGFTAYKELYVFYLLPDDNQQLPERIALGSRVLTKFLTPSILSKQALYLGLDNQQSESLEMFESACLLNHSEKCDEVTSYLNGVADRYQQFNNIRRDYNSWIGDNRE